MPQIGVGSVANDGTGDPLRTAFQRVNQSKLEWFNAQSYGAKGDGVADDAAAILAAANAAGPTGVTYVPSGTYKLTTGLATLQRLNMIGDGIGLTVLAPTSAVTGNVVSISPVATAAYCSVIGITFDLTSAPSATGLNVNNINFSQLRDLEFRSGAIGLNAANFGASRIANIVARNQTTAAVLVNGDGSGELRWDDIDIAVSSAAVTMLAGFKLTRTTTPDPGAQYFHNLRVTNPGAGTINNGIVFTSSAGSQSAAVAFFGTGCVVDGCNGGDAVFLSNVVDIEIDKMWSASSAAGGSNFAALRIDRCNNITVDGGRFFSNSRDISITGACSLIPIHKAILLSTATNVWLDAVGVKTSIDALDCLFNGTVTNDATQLANLTLDFPFKTSGAEFWVRGDSGGAQTLKLVNKQTAAPTPNKHLRVSGAGDFEVLNSAGTAAIGTIQEGGGYVSPGVVWAQGYFRSGQTVLTDAATVSLVASTGNSFILTATAGVGATRAMGAPTNPSVGQRIMITFIQDAAGGRALTWNAVFKVVWSDAGNTLNKRSSIAFMYDGTNWNQDGAQTPYV